MGTLFRHRLYRMAYFQQQGKIRQKAERKRLTRQGVTTDAQFLRMIGGPSSGQSALRVETKEGIEDTILKNH